VTGETIKLSQVERPEIEKKIPIDEFLVDIEENGGDLLVVPIPQQNFVTGRWGPESAVIQAVL
jgi:hypothetical protein